ncbi:hypothetical protein [Bacillus sp. KH172YL63]|uniref:hypothetical protein n=1 Tax=Bacillus sp. KH172YL63 TaxID=2709784 RepID=UPI0013E523A0|nr:hypothetical protein [Bacillus sp. KH172YL63]BCB04071.1 hypothetical protein KH172YL63_22040 [Bacillus sp. KH172YL63]
MEPIRIEQDDVKKAIQSGHSYIQVGKRKYLLMEVEEISNNDGYQVTDPEEEKQILKALEEDNPILSEEDIRKMLES